MPVVRRIRGRGATGWVEVHGEVLFARNGDVSQWTRGFSRRITRLTAAAAPSNKRPRWSHYGKALKRTFTSSTQSSPGTLKVHAAVGSTAPYAAYVDQGTGVYSGRGPYQAKILPPWTRQSPSLYEHTFNRPEPTTDRAGNTYIEWNPQGTITVKGQRGQFFFDEGLKRAFASEGMPTLQVPGVPPGMKMFPDRLANFVGNTPADSAFIAQLKEWRSWRDRAWYSDRILGQGYVRERERREFRRTKRDASREADRQDRAARRAKESAERSRRWRQAQKAKNMNKSKPRKIGANERRANEIKNEKQRVLMIARTRYPDLRYSIKMSFEDGGWIATVSINRPSGSQVVKVLTGPKKWA
jgi:hypothetical protein